LAEPDRSPAEPLGDDLLDADERAAADEQALVVALPSCCRK
jgi:hypothetical protein